MFRNREAMGYILAYAAHNWELFGLRGWIVAFLVFSQTLQPGYDGWNVTLIATLVALIAVPSSTSSCRTTWNVIPSGLGGTLP